MSSLAAADFFTVHVWTGRGLTRVAGCSSLNSTQATATSPAMMTARTMVAGRGHQVLDRSGVGRRQPI